MEKSQNAIKMVIEFNGQQHVVAPGDKIITNQTSAAEGDVLEAKDLLTGKNVSLNVVKKFLGDKIRGLKFHSKSRYTRRYGHRQNLMLLEFVVANEPKAQEKKSSTAPKAVKPSVKKSPTKKVVKKASNKSVKR